ncbi:hypothetical protein [Fontivita pretiosa]|uniref:hypothetical protein n=1 Tax=Fontivita pretiosa TaxID=2989684 RepID=UPI003D186143
MALGPMIRPARAQDAGPIVFGQRQRRDPFSLQITHAELELLYRRQSDTVDPDDGPKTTFTEDRFEETFSLWSNGYIYHPNLVELNLAGSFGLTQSWTDSDGLSDSQFGTLYEWDANATILRKEDTPLTLYSRRSRQLVTRELGPTLDNTITTHGGILELRSKAVPTRLEAFHQEQQQSGIDESGIGDFDLTQNTFIWHSEARPTVNQFWTWDYTFNQVQETTRGIGSHEFVNHDATLSHSMEFGRNDRSSLNSSVNYFDQSGDFVIRRLHWAELLRLEHSDSFTTRYQYTLDQQSFQDTEELTHRGTAGFIHRLYRSLVTTGEVGIQQTDRNSGGDSFQTFANIDFDYRKKVPLGVFTAALGYGWNEQRNDPQTQQTFVIDDPRTFNDPQPIIIPRSGVIPGSLVITDSTGLIIYQEGLDYTVRAFPDRLEIDRVIGGRITNGQTILLDYQLQPLGGNTTTTNGFYIGGRYTIEQGALQGVSVYARYSEQDQTIDSDTPIQIVPNSYTDVLYGIEYAIRPWHLTLSAEQQWHDATISPFDATRFMARYTDRIRIDTTLNLDASYHIVSYPDEDDTLNLLILVAQVQHRFSPRLWGSVSVLYRNEQDELRGETNGWEQQLELQWRHRQTYIYTLLRNTMVQTEFQDNTFQFLEIGIRREF